MTQDDCPSPTMTESEGVSTIEQYSGNNKSALFGKLIPDLLRKPTIIIFGPCKLDAFIILNLFASLVSGWGLCSAVLSYQPVECDNCEIGQSNYGNGP